MKDCNFYGLSDDYVVSGSDDGNLFIWDKLSGELVNILEGDGEVVNVVQGMSSICEITPLEYGADSPLLLQATPLSPS